MKKPLLLFLLIATVFIFIGSALAEGGVLVSGDNIDAVLVAEGFDTWTFDVEAGDSILLGVFSETFDSYLRLYGPDGELIAEDDDSGGGGDAVFWNYQISETGTYKVEVTEYYNTAGGEYQIFFNEIIVGGELEYGETITDSITITDQRLWFFDGLDGDTVSIYFNSDDFDTFLLLVDPFNDLVFTNDDFGDSVNSGIEDFVLLADGVYSIFVTSSYIGEFGEYDLELLLGDDAPPADPTPEPEQPSEDDLIAELGFEYVRTLIGDEVDVWTLYAEEGQIIDIFVNSADFDTYVGLYDKDAEQLEINDDGPDGTNSLIQYYTILETGIYYITISGYDASEAGEYTLSIMFSMGGPLDMGEIVVDTTITNTLGIGNWHGWDFTLDAEATVIISLESTEFDAYLELYGDEGFLTSDDDSLGNQDALISDYILPAGNYTVYASGISSSASGAYELGLYTMPEENAEYQRLVVNQTEYNLSEDGYLESGYYDAWQFSGLAGDVISISADSEDVDPYIELYNMADILLESNDDNGSSFNSLIDSFVLPADGMYEVDVMAVDMSSSGAYVLLISSTSEPTVVEDPAIVEDPTEGINGTLDDGVVEYATIFSENEAGQFGIIFLIDESDADDLVEELEDRDVGSDMEDWCDQVVDIFDDSQDLPNLKDDTFEETDDGFSCSMIYEFDDLDELEEIYDTLGFVDVKDLDIDSKENLDYKLDLEQIGLAIPSLLSDSPGVDYLWSVTVSGKIDDSSADEVDGKKAIWELDEGDDLEVELTAKKGGISPLLIFALLGGLVLLGGGGVGVFFLVKALKK